MLRLLASSFALVFVAALVATNTGFAADINYPTETVRLISTFEAGGGNDFMARVLAKKFSEEWKKTVIVEDRSGGAGDIGTELCRAHRAGWKHAAGDDECDNRDQSAALQECREIRSGEGFCAGQFAGEAAVLARCEPGAPSQDLSRSDQLCARTSR